LVYYIIIMFDYYYWNNFFTKEDLKELNKICLDNKVLNFKDNPAYANNSNKKLKNVNKIHGVEWRFLKQKLYKLEDEVKSTNLFHYGYNIYDIFDSDEIIFNTYEKNNLYEWHNDATRNNTFDIKFTVLINNSLEEYEGGKFKLFSYGGELEVVEYNKPGSFIMFESKLFHKVFPIINGKRNSIAIFIKGPKFI